MNSTDGIDALRRANPRGEAGFAEAVEAARRVRTDLLEHAVPESEAAPRRSLPRRVPRRRWAAVSAAGLGAAAVAGVLAVVFGVVSPGSGVDTTTGAGSGGQEPLVSLRLAAAQTSTAAEDSGRAVVRVTKDARPWAGKTVLWNGEDIAVTEGPPSRPGKVNREIRVVDGIVYMPNPEGSGWVRLGSPENFDPDSGTTPLEILAAVRDDTAGQTLTRITSTMTGLETETHPDGSVTYSGKVPAGILAPEQSVKEGQTIRVLPYGYVANDAASDPASLVDVSITAGPDHMVQNITARWGGGSAWTYTVTFSQLGTAPQVKAPANAKSLEDIRRSRHATPANR